ncbi:MAG: glycerol-3-phosphate 1-O-acyltransferase PlsY [Parvibaculales bacterium]
MEITQLAGFWIVAGYLAGSVPFGLLLTHLSGLGDIRNIGSGNIGSTNVLRTGNKKLALATLILDAAKAGVVVAVARQFAPEQVAYFAGAGALIGHVYPVWLKFKGGKGIATYLGFMLAANPELGLVFALVWLGVAGLSRISSLSALTACAITPAYALYLGNAPLAAISLMLSCLAFWAHRANLSRLLKGEEPKIGQKQQ